MDRPNVFLIYTDQQRWDCLGVHGHPLAVTPHIDRLAGEGVDFRNAFCTVPLCTPARASLLSGVWPSEHLSITNWDTEAPRPLRDGLPVFPQMLREAGYYLGYVGKWHVHSEQDPTHFGFHDYVPESDYFRWREQEGLPPQPMNNSWFGETDWGIRPDQTRLAWGADHILRLLAERTQCDRPFFLRWDPWEPHLPNVVPEPYASLYNPADIEPWDNWEEAFVNKPYAQRNQLHNWDIQDWRWEDWAPIVARYLGEITLLDAQIGRILAYLAASGLAERTLVVFTSDHGDMCGSHRMMDKHFVMYEEVVRVPLIMRWSGVLPAGVVCNDFVSNSLDLAATFCSAGTGAVPSGFSGLDLLPAAALAPDRVRRDDIFVPYYGNQFGLYSQRMVRYTRWKYVWNASAEDELYDLDDDPAELCNLAAFSSYNHELARLRARLVAWMETTDDRLLNPWTRRALLGAQTGQLVPAFP